LINHKEDALFNDIELEETETDSKKNTETVINGTQQNGMEHNPAENGAE